MVQRVISITLILIGLALTTYGVFLFTGSEFETFNKYSPQGRDNGSILLIILIGLSLVAYGFGEYISNSK